MRFYVAVLGANRVCLSFASSYNRCTCVTCRSLKLHQVEQFARDLGSPGGYLFNSWILQNKSSWSCICYLPYYIRNKLKEANRFLWSRWAGFHEVFRIASFRTPPRRLLSDISKGNNNYKICRVSLTRMRLVWLIKINCWYNLFLSYEYF